MCVYTYVRVCMYTDVCMLLTFPQVINLVEKRADQLDVVLVDTPGQIEIFTWSASGAIVTEAFASTFPTLICYVVDTPRSANPITFMSNMLYACGILYKTRLPMLLAFNKIDIQRHEFAIEVSMSYGARGIPLFTVSAMHTHVQEELLMEHRVLQGQLFARRYTLAQKNTAKLRAVSGKSWI